MSQGTEELRYVPLLFMITQSMLIIKIMCIGIPLKVLCNKLFLVKGSMLFFFLWGEIDVIFFLFFDFLFRIQNTLILKGYCLDFFSPLLVLHCSYNLTISVQCWRCTQRGGWFKSALCFFLRAFPRCAVFQTTHSESAVRALPPTAHRGRGSARLAAEEPREARRRPGPAAGGEPRPHGPATRGFSRPPAAR